MSAIEKVPFIPEVRFGKANACQCAGRRASDAVALSWRVVAATRRIPAVARVI